jgi:6-phosphogluconolactonase/glucosamine-6-phosphate isomerase/deaminase
VLSVFPGSAAFDSPAVALPIPAPSHVTPYIERVTLNPAVLDAARSLVVVVIGSAKAAVMADVLGPVRDERRWPAQRARRAGATWYLDEAAAPGSPDRSEGS